jgi:tetratricopeptide (TPR) repeat protein
MAPEQLTEAPVTERTDIYAIGLVLYESATGERFPARSDPKKVDWSRVPPVLRRPIRRAVQLDPAERWQNVTSFAAGLESVESSSRVRWSGAGAFAAAMLAGVVLWYLRPGPTPPPLTYDVAVFPFGVVGLDSTLGPRLAGLTDWTLSFAQQVTTAPKQAAYSVWYASPLPPPQRLAALTGPATQSRYGAWGNVSPKGDLLELRLTVVGRDAKPAFEGTVTGAAADPAALADSVAALITRGVFAEEFVPAADPSSGARQQALGEFVLGDHALARAQWLTAERYYLRALELDSTFVLAAWKLGNVRRWMPLRTGPPYPAGLLTLLREHGAEVPEVDRRLIEAQFKPSGVRRFEQYEKAIAIADGDKSGYLLYGDELLHRGPLVGRSMEEAAEMLRRAVSEDSTLAPAWEHLAWARVRLGDRERADSALVQLERWAGGPEGSEIHVPTFVRMAYAVRFGGAAAQEGVVGSLSRSPEQLALAARGALSFELPAAQVVLGAALAHAGPTPEARASGFVGRGVALVTLGRAAEAQAAFDSAAALFPDPREARLQAAQWRVIPAALGVPGWSEEERERGRRALRAMRGDGLVGERAAWSLALDARARGDTAATGNYAEGLAALLNAMDSAAQGNWSGALAASEPALALDSAGRGDPFLRAALHLQRGAWLERAGRVADADRSLLWYENLDLVGWPSATAQAAEVDWALATYARTRRARLALASGERARGCAQAESVAEAWSGAEPAVAAAGRELADLARSCAP